MFLCPKDNMCGYLGAQRLCRLAFRLAGVHICKETCNPSDYANPVSSIFLNVIGEFEKSDREHDYGDYGSYRR
jgi:hypothetical protein